MSNNVEWVQYDPLINLTINSLNERELRRFINDQAQLRDSWGHSERQKLMVDEVIILAEKRMEALEKGEVDPDTQNQKWTDKWVGE